MGIYKVISAELPYGALCRTKEKAVEFCLAHKMSFFCELEHEQSSEPKLVWHITQNNSIKGYELESQLWKEVTSANNTSGGCCANQCQC